MLPIRELSGATLVQGLGLCVPLESKPSSEGSLEIPSSVQTAIIVRLVTVAGIERLEIET